MSSSINRLRGSTQFLCTPGLIEYRLALLMEILSGCLALSIATLINCTIGAYASAPQAVFTIIISLTMFVKAVITVICILFIIKGRVFQYAHLVIVSSVMGIIFSTSVILMNHLAPFRTENIDPFHFGHNITFQCLKVFASFDQSDVDAKELVGISGPLSTKCDAVHASLTMMVVYFAFQVILLLTPCRLVYMMSARRSFSVMRPAIPLRDLYEHELQDMSSSTANRSNGNDAPEFPELVPLESNHMQLENPFALHTDLHLAVEPSNEGIWLSFESDGSNVVSQPQAVDEQQRWRSIALHSLPERPYPAAIRALSRRRRPRALSSTIEQYDLESVPAMVPQSFISTTDHRADT